MEEICDEKCQECAAVGVRRPTGDNDQQQLQETPHRPYLQQRAWRAQATSPTHVPHACFNLWLAKSAILVPQPMPS